MKKVDIIHGGWLKAPNGASSVLRTLAESTSNLKNTVFSFRFIQWI